LWSAPPVFESGLEVLESIESLAGRIGLNVAMGSLHTRAIQASPEQAEALGRRAGERADRGQPGDPGGQPAGGLPGRYPAEGCADSRRPGGRFHRLGARPAAAARRRPSWCARWPRCAPPRRRRGLPAGWKSSAATCCWSSVARLYTVEERVIDYSLSYFLPGYFRFQVVRRVGDRSAETIYFLNVDGE
jgi:GntR family transcriptional regulator